MEYFWPQQFGAAAKFPKESEFPISVLSERV